MTPRWPPLPRRLPRTLVPLRHEAYESYLARLAAANRVSFGDLDELAFPADGDLASLGRLAALTGCPVAVLHALPELRHHASAGTSALARGAFPIPETFINDIRPPCRRCAAAGGADPGIARIWATHDMNVCLRHRLWTGEGNNHPGQQVDLDPHPAIVHAQIRHQRILRRRGRPATRAAFRTACGIWGSLSTTPGYTRQRDARTARMRLAGNSAHAGEAIAEAASYPETVALTAILASPYWRAVLVSRTPAGNQRFHHEFRRRVAPDHYQDRYPRLLFWLRRDLEWHPAQDEETAYTATPHRPAGH